MSIIEVKNLTKEYQLGQIGGIKQNLKNAISRLQGKPAHQREKFKALDNVSFSINEGEVVGIIGHNGAGKSTLLKHLAHISKPTSGEVWVRGSVAPLIEVGAGVNPELTGRENIFLNGAILGIPKKVIKRKLDEIIEFSELDQFIDTPVKRYSSGMTVKLGFSIATSMDADILIIDEVLAVGDLAFQRKCFDRMEDLIRRTGNTVLLVSHNIRQVERMCDRVILMEHGKVLVDGDSRQVCNQFYNLSNTKINKQKKSSDHMRIQTSGEVKSVVVDFLDVNGKNIESILEGEAFQVRVKFELTSNQDNLEFHIGTHTTDFVYLTGESTAVLGNSNSWEKGINEIRQAISHFPFVAGTYGVRFAVLDSSGRVLFHGENLAFINVIAKNDDAPMQDDFRLISLPVRWSFNNSLQKKDV